MAISVVMVFSLGNKQPIYYNILRSSPIVHEWDIAVDGRKDSEKLNKFFEKHEEYPSQGVIPAGGTALAYKGFTNDLLGLNNVEMAHAEKNKSKDVFKNHASFNKDVFYKQKPDLVWLSAGFEENSQLEHVEYELSLFQTKVLQQIQDDQKFLDKYSAVVITNKNLDYSLRIFALNEFLNNLDPSVYTYRKIMFHLEK